MFRGDEGVVIRAGDGVGMVDEPRDSAQHAAKNRPSHDGSDAPGACVAADC